MAGKRQYEFVKRKQERTLTTKESKERSMQKNAKGQVPNNKVVCGEQRYRMKYQCTKDLNGENKVKDFNL